MKPIDDTETLIIIHLQNLTTAGAAVAWMIGKAETELVWVRTTDEVFGLISSNLMLDTGTLEYWTWSYPKQIKNMYYVIV